METLVAHVAHAAPTNMPKLGPEKIVYTGNIFTIKQREVTFDSGQKQIYEYCERPPSVSVLAFNKQGKLLMIKEKRRGYKKNVWFLPGGRADKKEETTRKAAQRELREETGYRAKKMKLLHKKTPSNTLLWDIYIYVAKDLVLDPLPQDLGEEIEPIFVSFKKAVQMAKDGTIDNEFISYNIIRLDYMIKHKQFIWKD